VSKGANLIQQRIFSFMLEINFSL